MPTKKNKDKDIDSDIESSKKIVSENLSILKLLKNRTLLQLVIFLLIFPKLSLSKLSKLSKKSKSTVSRQLSKLEQLDALIISRRQARGSIDAKVYELPPDFLKLKSYILKSLKDFQESNNFKFFGYSIKNDILIFEVIKQLFDQTIEIYEEIDDFLNESDSLISFNPKSLSPNDLVNYDLWFLTEDEIEAYKQIFSNFKSKMKELIEKNQKNRNEEVKPYLILHTFFPLLDYFEIDTDKKPLKKFFKALD
ncbi:MAG: hypothetical protein GF353_00540 [Candidatus Lokiarchaeota archaeon]|nr:hypothetical protein [Candidatus Lokiarchaeota archaeon]